nr:EOG090X05E6 [Eulimnadia texana]
MGARMKKKYETGEGARYMTRNQALKKLQLNLKDFRRLCILKGIYPREPNNRKKAQKGATDKKTLYHVKDIRFLMHEPLLWKFRDFKVYMKKLKKALEKNDKDTANRLRENKPTLQLDHLVKERYPTFTSALHDLDDCLTLCFYCASLPHSPRVPLQLINLCRRLTVEFLHYVIEARALRKVFISIKGIYYQAEIKGQTITWIVPHQRGFKPISAHEVDLKIMMTFIDFYTTMLGFVNFRLYHSLNLNYPPKLPGMAVAENDEQLKSEEYGELVAALNRSIVRTEVSAEEEPQLDEFNSELQDASGLEEAKKKAEQVKKLQQLFKGLKFFLSREVPRDAMVFIIRACGGEVSWDESVFPGATFPETDESITHQIVDRPSVDKQYLSRYYVQPQWAFDCINFCTLLPVEDYFVGASLPPHISPFAAERTGDYVPPERQRQLALERGEQLPDETDEGIDADKTEEDEEDEDQDEDEDEEEDEDDDDSGEEEDEEKSEGENVKTVKGMSVVRGRVEKLDTTKQEEQDEKEHYRFRESAMKKKHRKLYRSMMRNRHRREKEARKLGQKRQEIEAEKKKGQWDVQAAPAKKMKSAS